MSLGHIEYLNFIPGYAPADATTADTPTPWINMSECHKVGFLAIFGAQTASAADVVTFKVEVSSVSASGAESAVPFMYRLSGAIAANTWTAPTAAASSYAPLQTAVDSKLVYLEVDPSLTLATKADAKWVRATLTAGGTATLVGWVAMTEPRFRQQTVIANVSA
jgi:hypothetical protein